MSNQKTEIPNSKNSYFLRTQSSILKGEQTIPFNSLRSKTKDKNNSSTKYKTNTPGRVFNNISSSNVAIKTKKYINIKNGKNKGLGMIDLNKVSGSSHSSNQLKNKSFKNIKPNESNGFSLKGSMGAGDGDNHSQSKNKKNYNDYLTNNKTNEKDKNNMNKKIYNSKLYSPFYNLIENIDKSSNNKNNHEGNINNISNNNFLSSNHIIEINNNENINNNDKKNALNINDLNNNDKDIPKNELNYNKDSLHNYVDNKHELNKPSPLNIQTNEDLYNTYDACNEYRESLMSKTMDCLHPQNNYKNEFNTHYNYNTENKNNFIDYNNNNKLPNNIYSYSNKTNTYNYNENQNDNYKNNLNKNSSHKNLTYQYIESNNNNINDINLMDNYSNNTHNRVKHMIDKLNYTMNNNNTYRSRTNEYNESFKKKLNNINNTFYQLNIKKINNNNSNSNLNKNNLSKNKSVCHYETYDSNKGRLDLDSKYFLKSIFEQKSIDNFMNEINYFSPLKSNRKYLSKNFEFFNNKEKEKECIHTPRSFVNIQKSENKLEKLLKTIPRHEKDKKNNKYNNSNLKKYDFCNVYKKNNINKNNDICSLNQNKKKKILIEEVDTIMPPNMLEYE